MNRVLKLFSSVLVICTLLLSPFGMKTANAVTQPSLLALGDSIAYGMSATPSTSSYVNLLLNNLQTIPTYSDPNFTLVNLAVPGATSGDLFASLAHGAYSQAVSNADVITLSIGGNNLLSPVIGATCQACGVNPVANPNMMSELATAMATDPIKTRATLSGIATSPALATALQQGVVDFGTDFPKIIGALKALSPQAQIYVLNLYNPFNAQDPLYATFDTLIAGINQAIKSNDSAGYKVADVYADFKTTPGAVDFNLETIKLDPHPTTVGHAAIYQAILDADATLVAVTPVITDPDPVVDTETVTPVVPVTTTVTGGELPVTSTPIYNLLLIGVVLTLLGALGWRTRKRFV